MATTSSTTDLKGKTLGGFRVGELLGKGGMGAVFQGRDLNLDRPVAIKILAPHLAEDAEYRDRFVREARVAAKLNHPNIVQIYRAAYEGGVTYMALELVTGCSLHELLQQHPNFPARRACELIRDAAKGLALAHEHGIVHRDLKPENILVTPKGRPKLADFGLARSADQRITATGMFLGTPQYASPEQCNGEEVTAQSDLYSLGVVLYELLAGHPPHEAPTPLALFQKILGEEHQPLSEAQPGLPPSLGAIVDRLLSKQPEERYASAEQLIRDLEQVIPGLPEPEAAADPLENIESTIVQAPGVHTKSTAPGLENSRLETAEGPAIVVPGTSDGTVELSFEDQVAEPDAVTVNLQRPGDDHAPAEAPPTRALQLVVGILVLVLAGLLIAKLAPTDPTPDTPGPTPTGQPVAASKYHYPLRVAILPWGNKAQAKDFAWLADALPGFVRSRLQRSEVIKVISPAKVSRALRGLKNVPPAERGLALLAALEADVVVSGSFYVADGEQVGIDTLIEDASGDTIGFGLSPHVFGKKQVLAELKKLAAALSTTIGSLAPVGELGEDEDVVAAARASTLSPELRKVSRAKVSKLERSRLEEQLALAQTANRDAKQGGKDAQQQAKHNKLKSPRRRGRAVRKESAEDKAKEPVPPKDDPPPPPGPGDGAVPAPEGKSAPGKPTANPAPGKAAKGYAGRPRAQPPGTPAADDDRADQDDPQKSKLDGKKLDLKQITTYGVATHPLIKKLAAKDRWDTWELGDLLRACVECKTVEVKVVALKVLARQSLEQRELFNELAEQLKQKLPAAEPKK